MLGPSPGKRPIDEISGAHTTKKHFRSTPVSGYTPVFRSIFDGTLHGKWPQTGVWLALLAMADRHGCIDRTPQAIASDIGISVDELMSCIGEFCQPDPMSRTQDHEGRRLVLIEPSRAWGWRVVNHTVYREKARLQGKDAARVASGKDAERKRIQRTSPAVPRNPPPAPSQTPDSYSDTDKNKNLPSGGMSSDKRSTSTLAEQVFEHWRKTWNHPKAILDPKRRKRIEARLKDFTPEQLCDAISGFRNSPWHMGTDPKGQGVVYGCLHTLLRDTGQVEVGLGFLARPPRPPPKPENATERILRHLNGTDESRVIEHDPDEQTYLPSY